MSAEATVHLDDRELIMFKAIARFIGDLNEEFGARYKSIALYNRLLEKTSLLHVNPIKKHIECFRQFYLKNAEAVEKCEVQKFNDSKIAYSANVFVDVATIIRASQPEDVKIIWKHLLTIWNLIDPLSAASRVLKDSQSSENHMLQNIMSKVQETAQKANISDDSNPAQIMNSMMQSGAMSELMNGMFKGINDGSIDIGKIFGSLQGMIGGMQGMQGMQGGPGPQGGPQGMPDLGSIMGMMGPMMSQIMGGMGGAGGMGGDVAKGPDSDSKQ